MGRRSILAGALCLVLGACTATGRSAHGPFRPTFALADCPRDVEVQLLVAHSCGYLTVLADRSAPDGPRLQLLVVTFTPPIISHPDPVLIVGDGIGGLPNYGMHQAEAERLHRVVYVLEQRGTAHTRPSLSCDDLDASSRGGQTGGPWRLPKFLAAVTACRARLAEAGLDPADLDLAAMAADIEDLRQALQIGTWNLTSFGTASQIVYEVIRESPENVRAAYLDSSAFLPLEDQASAARATGLVVRDLFRTCSAERSCRASYPNLRAMWRRAISGLARDPVEAAVGRASVLVDDGLFIRVLRTALAGDNADMQRFPAILREASRHRLDADLATVLATSGPLCVGYRSGCGPGISTAVYLTVLCGVSAAASIERPSVEGPGAELLGMRHAFSANPYTAACARWGASRPGPASPFERSTVPVLLVSGEFDPFSPPELTHGSAGSSSVAFTVDVLGASRFPLQGDACAIAVRDAWLKDPSSAPPDAPCLSAGRISFLSDR